MTIINLSICLYDTKIQDELDSGHCGPGPFLWEAGSKNYAAGVLHCDSMVPSSGWMWLSSKVVYTKIKWNEKSKTTMSQGCLCLAWAIFQGSKNYCSVVFLGRHEEKFSKKVKHEEDFCKKKLSIWAVGWRYADAPLSWTHPRNVISWSSTNTRNTSIGAAKKLHFRENQVIFTIFDKEAAGCQQNSVL